VAEFALPVERLRDDPERFEYEIPAAHWLARVEASDLDREEAPAPLRVELEARRVGTDLLLEGTLTGEVGLECSRCARRYAHALREPFRLVLEPVEGAGSVEALDEPEGRRGLRENGLCLGEDLEAGWFRGPVIRLGEFFGELIALAMPIQPLCREDCPGICPHCGADRAEERCACEDEKVESPFAVLRRLKESKP